jgi:hypothetical protein
MFPDPHVTHHNEGYEYVRYAQFEVGERTDDGNPLCSAVYELREQRNRRLKRSEEDHVFDTNPDGKGARR